MTRTTPTPRQPQRSVAHSLLVHPLLLPLLLHFVSSLSWASPGPQHLPAVQPTVFCQVNGQVRDALEVDGAWFLAGDFDLARPWGEAPGGPGEVTRRGVVKCTALGGIDAWDADLAHSTVADTDVRSLGLSPDRSTIYVAGRFVTAGTSTRRHAAAFDVTSAALLAWDPNLGARANTLLAEPSGSRVYVGGSFSTVGGTSRPLLAALDATSGALITAFEPVLDNPDGFETVYDVALSEDTETLFIGGVFDTANAWARSSVAAVDAATGLVTTDFAPDLADPNPNDPEVQVYEIHIDRDSVYLCGDWWVTEGIGDMVDQRNVNRFDTATGLADRSFWVATDGGVQACDLDLVARVLYVAGHFDVVNGAVIRDLFAMRLDGGSLSAWTPGTNGIPGVWALRLAAGKLVVGGTFTQAGGVDAESAAAFPLERTATLVIDDPTLPHVGDLAVLHRLEDPLGFSVTLLDDDLAQGPELDTPTLGLISGTASSTVLGTLFKEAAAPLLVWNPTSYDEMQMTGSVEGTDYGLVDIQGIEIVDSAHPLAADLSDLAGPGGVVDIFTSTQSTAWGEPAGDGRALARAETGQSDLFVYGKGELLADGSQTVNCRVGFPLHHTAASALAPLGSRLLDTAVAWTAALCPDTVLIDGFETGDLTNW